MISPARLEQIRDYREQCRLCYEIPDVGFAHEAIDDLLGEILALRRELNSFASDSYTEDGYCRICGKFFTDCTANHNR